MKRIAKYKELHFSYANGFSSINHQFHSVESTNSCNSDYAATHSSIISNITHNETRQNDCLHSAYFSQVKCIITSLNKLLPNKMKLYVTMNFRDCDICFANGKKTFPGHSIGRIAILHNGTMQYRDFACVANINQLRICLEQHFWDLKTECERSETPSEQLDEPTLLVFRQKAAAFLVHEVIGHLMEKDQFEQFSSIFPDKVNIGHKIFPKEFNIYDDPYSTLGLRFGQFDDNGQIMKKRHVIKDGRINELIETYRSATYYDEPLYRMCNLYLDSNQEGRSYSEIIQSFHADAVEIEEIIAGGVDPYTGQYFVCTGLRKIIREGKYIAMLHPCTYSGNIYEFANKVVEVGCDFASFMGMCTKNGQSVYVGSGAPTLVLSDIPCV